MTPDTFITNVTNYLTGLTAVSTGACPGCDDCGLSDCEDTESEEYQCAGEAHFSWSNCECCCSTLGGDRHPAHAMSDGKLVHMNICTDCLFHIEFGETPEKG
jgi:hypothetical protein